MPFDNKEKRKRYDASRKESRAKYDREKYERLKAKKKEKERQDETKNHQLAKESPKQRAAISMSTTTPQNRHGDGRKILQRRDDNDDVVGIGHLLLESVQRSSVSFDLPPREDHLQQRQQEQEDEHQIQDTKKHGIRGSWTSTIRRAGFRFGAEAETPSGNGPNLMETPHCESQQKALSSSLTIIPKTKAGIMVFLKQQQGAHQHDYFVREEMETQRFAKELEAIEQRASCSKGASKGS
ncbi:hypothetical protein IV203_020116 [Nitzschia inconspicua]|uniref:Uncharacterized protein n=1 Tax=Nitzschia inconspicua TaxID=303405 RepID=A0A9K3Q5K3_9STRA|nr:hypothetical protein IV203_020116 [Nitzschia inconspicua]